MTDYAAYIPVVNRFDLLRQAIDNAAETWEDLTIIDNSPIAEVAKIIDYVNVTRFPFPLSFTQSMNFEFQDTIKRGKKFTLHMHSDSIVPAGAIDKLLEAAREIDATKKWGVIYTHYDIMAIYNPYAAMEIGGYDTFFPAYFSDNDFYHRLELAGYERFNTGIEVGHHGSQTINSDPYLRYVNGITFPLLRQYYVAKWGGEPGHEAFQVPFNIAF